MGRVAAAAARWPELFGLPRIGQAGTRAVNPVNRSAALRYESARREGGKCQAMLLPPALSLPPMHRQQTWTCKTMRQLVIFRHDGDAFEYTFG